MKTRIFKDKNYKAIYHNGKTLRLALDNNLPILELDYPEFYDVKITNYCTGNCPWCYMDSKDCGEHFENIIEKTRHYFGNMSENERPFQVAIGGGNPNQHPDFIRLLETFDELGITPNYTTNGIGLTDEILVATKKYCGGVAVSCHKHLILEWSYALYKLTQFGIRTNLHLIISDKASIDYFVTCYNLYKDDVDYFVLLPHIPQGRAKRAKIDYEYLHETLKTLDMKKIAFGANFYEFLKGINGEFSISLYEPEILSKFLDMSDMKLYYSSFNLKEYKPNGKKKLDIRDVLVKYLSGEYGQKEISQEYGYSRERIRQILVKYIGQEEIDRMKMLRKGNATSIEIERYNRIRLTNLLKSTMSDLPRFHWNYQECLDCGSTILKYHAHGRCIRCDARFVYATNQHRREQQAISTRKWMKNNPEKTKIIQARASKKWWEKKKASGYVRPAEYFRDRYSTDPIFREIAKLRTRISYYKKRENFEMMAELKNKLNELKLCRQ